MVSGTRDNPPPRDNLTERLYGVVSCNTLVSLETARQVTYWTK